MDLGLRGKRAILTGATKGIGRRILDQLVQEGCNVAICSRSIEDVELTIDSVTSKRAKVIGDVCNIVDKEDYEDWINRMVKEMGGVDIFIPNVSAGGGMDSERNWHKNFNVDILGTVRGCEAVLPHMQEQGHGAITLMGTTAAVETFGVPQAFNAMKAALITYGKQLSQFIGHDNIRVNVVSPGPIEFPGGTWEMLKDTMPKWYQKTARDHLTGRLGTPEEVAKCVAFISSDAASWVNGTNFIVDGGFTKRVQF